MVRDIVRLKEQWSERGGEEKERESKRRTQKNTTNWTYLLFF